MPSWTPNWSDVQFDHAAAAAYSTACEQAALQVHAWIAGREAAARDAIQDWEGPHRLSFDQQLVRLHQQARLAAAALMEDAHRAVRASAEATWEQSRRVAERQRWMQELAREEVAAQEAARAAEAAQARAAQQALSARPDTGATVPTTTP